MQENYHPVIMQAYSVNSSAWIWPSNKFQEPKKDLPSKMEAGIPIHPVGHWELYPAIIFESAKQVIWSLPQGHSVSSNVLVVLFHHFLTLLLLLLAALRICIVNDKHLLSLRISIFPVQVHCIEVQCCPPQQNHHSQRAPSLMHTAMCYGTKNTGLRKVLAQGHKPQNS